MRAFSASAASNFAILQPLPVPIFQALPAAVSAAPVETRDIGESSKSPESDGVGISISPLLLKQRDNVVYWKT